MYKKRNREERLISIFEDPLVPFYFAYLFILFNTNIWKSAQYDDATLISITPEVLQSGLLQAGIIENTILDIEVLRSEVKIKKENK